MSGLEPLLLGVPAALSTAAPIAAGTTAQATPAALAASLSAAPATSGLLGTAGITAGAGAAPTIGSLGTAAGFGVQGIGAGQALGVFGRDVAQPSEPSLPGPQFSQLSARALPIGIGQQVFGEASQAASQISADRQRFIDQFLRGI